MARIARRTAAGAATLGHAVVLGGSMAGLAAAAALAPHTEKVTLVERDTLAEIRQAAAEAPRRGVPQGKNLHTLLPGGLAALDSLLPGIAADFQAAGAHLVDRSGDNVVMAAGGRVRFDLLGPSFMLIGATRPLMEHVVRERTLSLPNVELRAGRRVTGLVPARSGREVRGVRLAPGAEGGQEDTMAADLVVDATGRGSRTPRWLEALGYEAPPEQRLGIDARYTTRFFRKRSEVPENRLAIYIAMLPGGYRQAGASVVEGDRWMVSLMGLAGVQAPTELAGYREYARSLWSSVIHDVVSAAEPLGQAVTGSYPANVWRRYDRLARLPRRLVVMGDALCATNPHYVRGMSMAALEAVRLGRVLARRGPARAGPAFFRATRGLVGEQWTFVTDNDLLQPAVEGTRSLRWRLTAAYAKRVMQASHRDPRVAKAFMDVFGMLAPPARLLRPDILGRALLARRRAPVGSAAAAPLRSDASETSG